MLEKINQKSTSDVRGRIRQCLMLVLLSLVTLAVDPAVAQEFQLMNDACGRLLQLVEGPFGALVTAAAGIGAIIASAVGSFRSAWSLLVVAVSAFILRSYITLFFAPCFSGL